MRRDPLPSPATWIHCAGFGIIEIPGWIGLKIEGELVKTRRGHHVVIEILIEIRLAITIEIVQARNLIAAKDIDLVVNDFQPQRLEKSRGVAFPDEVIKLVVDAGNDPD